MFQSLRSIGIPCEKIIWADQKSKQAAKGHRILQNSKEENETKEQNTDQQNKPRNRYPELL